MAKLPPNQRPPTLPPTIPPPPRPLRAMAQDGRMILCHPEPFSSGSEGRLFFTQDGTQVVKLYSRPEPWRQASLDQIIAKRSSVLAENAEYWSFYFCWPEARIDQPALGLVMRRAAPDLRPFAQLLSPRFRQRLAKEHGPAVLGSWIGHVGILIKLARTVSRLHQCGLCHSDLSPNNVLVNPQKGTSTLIDCDGLVETGSKVLLPTVLGTPDYMAPELVEGMVPRPGHPPPQPSLATDLHALAVLIYQGLLFRHPLRGPAFHSSDPDEDERLMLGPRALYIEHPTDAHNRPKAPFLHANILGTEMQDLLGRAFLEGLHQPSKRPLAAEWERALVRMYDQTVPCSNPACEAKSFVLIDGGAARCPWCRVEVKGPTQIPIFYFYRPRQDGRSITTTTHFNLDFRFVGWHGRMLQIWHVEPNRLPGPNVDVTPLGEFAWEAESRQERWYLLNRGIEQIQDVSDGQNALTIPGKKILLREGMKLKFSHNGKLRLVEVHLPRLA